MFGQKGQHKQTGVNCKKDYLQEEGLSLQEQQREAQKASSPPLKAL